MRTENIQIAIVSPYYVYSCGLKYILSDFFVRTNSDIDIFDDYSAYAKNIGNCDLIFMDALLYLAVQDLFIDKKKLVLLVDKSMKAENKHTDLTFLDMTLNRDDLMKCLDKLWSNLQPLKYDEVAKELSDREREVLILVIKGNTSKEIAALLNISLYTVQAHRKNISAKLGIKSVSALTVYAMMNGIVPAVNSIK